MSTTATTAPARKTSARATKKASAPAKAKTTPAKKATPAPSSACLCGCKAIGKGAYRPGHDARHAGSVGRALASTNDDAARKAFLKPLSSALQAKARAMEARIRKQAAIRDAREKAKADLQAAIDAA